MTPFRETALRFISLGVWGAATYGLFQVFWDPSPLQRFGYALVSGFFVAAAFFNSVDGFLTNYELAKREAVKHGKIIEFSQLKIAYGAFFISLFALAMSAYPYVAPDAR